MAKAPLFIFDLDNTLYSPELPLWRMVDARIERYVQNTLGADAAAARAVRLRFLVEYGSTLRGLMQHHGVRPSEYLEYIHDLPIPEIVPPRPELKAMLSELPGRRVVFTNGSEDYARRVLGALGVEATMEGVFGIEFMEYLAKPSPYPYTKLLRATETRAEDSLFCEDSRRNLRPAHEMGMFTVWVGDEKHYEASRIGGAPSVQPFRPHAVVCDVCELPGVLHEFPPVARANGMAARAARRKAAPRNHGGSE
jgi:putative hydrolase of the HAD superfamily